MNDLNPQYYVLAAMLCIGIAACTPSAPQQSGSADASDFLSKQAQSVDEREVAATLVPVDSFSLSSYDVFEAYRLVVDDQRIYVRAEGLGKILAVDKNDYGTYTFIGQGRGEGHGELAGPGDFDISADHIVASNRPFQLARFTKDGAYLDEPAIDHRPERLVVTDDGELLTFDVANSDYLFMLMNADGTAARGIVAVPESEEGEALIGPLRYSGFVDYHRGQIYYASYAESLIKKFAPDGSELFSVSTIDNYPSSASNYIRDANVVRYSPNFLFSSINLHVYGGYILVQPAMDHHGQMLNYLDVYDADTGAYVRSYGVTYPPTDYAADDNYLYLLQLDRSPETGELDKYIKRYENMLRDP